MKKLSPKQQQIYDYIIDFAARHGYPPPCGKSGSTWGSNPPPPFTFI